jgi:predicted site-specific integrase-resolvase
LVSLGEMAWLAGSTLVLQGHLGDRRRVRGAPQEEGELRATATGTVVRVIGDGGSGLRESRPGLNRVLAMVSGGWVTVVRVTREDRLARFGAGWLRRLLSVYGVTLVVLHPERSGGRDESPEDFASLVTMFAGRLYGMRSAGARVRLLAEAGQRGGGERAA